MRRTLAAAAVGGLALGLFSANPAAALGPGVSATAACTTELPYETDVLGHGFAPDATIWAVARFSGPSSNFAGQISFPSDENGNLDLNLFGRFNGRGPHEVGMLFFNDRDGTNSYTQGDDEIANLLLTIDKPCAGAVAQPK